VSWLARWPSPQRSDVRTDTFGYENRVGPVSNLVPGAVRGPIDVRARPWPPVSSLVKSVSPAAWRHVHLNGHYTFRSRGQTIDLDVVVQGLKLE
jgi:hypothetical protein